MHSNSSTALRWRARITREAIDSTLSLDETDVSIPSADLRDSRWRWMYHFCSNCLLSRRRFLLRIILLTTAGSLSLYTLLVASRSWQNAVTVTLQLAVLVILVLQGMSDIRRPLTDYRKLQAATRRQRQAVRERHENILHKIRVNQTAIDKVSSVLQEIALYATETLSVEDLIGISEEQKEIRKSLMEASRREFLRDVVSMVLTHQEETNWDKHPIITSSVLEKIIVSCKKNPALDFDERSFRESLVDESDEIHLTKLLRVVTNNQWRWTPERLLTSKRTLEKQGDEACGLTNDV